MSGSDLYDWRRRFLAASRRDRQSGAKVTASTRSCSCRRRWWSLKGHINEATSVALVLG